MGGNWQAAVISLRNSQEDLRESATRGVFGVSPVPTAASVSSREYRLGNRGRPRHVAEPTRAAERNAFPAATSLRPVSGTR